MTGFEQHYPIVNHRRQLNEHYWIGSNLKHCHAIFFIWVWTQWWQERISAINSSLVAVVERLLLDILLCLLLGDPLVVLGLSYVISDCMLIKDLTNTSWWSKTDCIPLIRRLLVAQWFHWTTHQLLSKAQQHQLSYRFLGGLWRTNDLLIKSWSNFALGFKMLWPDTHCLRGSLFLDWCYKLYAFHCLVQVLLRLD